MGRNLDRLCLQHRRLIFRKIRKLAGASQYLPAPCDVGFASSTGCRDLALDQVLFERTERAARRFDFLKQLPGGSAKPSCQGFDGAGTGSRIGYFCQIGFFQQDQLPSAAANTAIVARSMFT
jgi:hypothetical protein